MKAALLGVLGCALVACEDAPRSALARRETLLNDPEVNPVAAIAADAKTFLEERDGSRLALGSSCYYAPSRPPAWFAVKDLLATGRTGFLIDLANSAPTNEGRLWAVYGLILSQQLDAGELVARATVIGEPIWTCEGCFVWQAKPTEAIERLP